MASVPESEAGVNGRTVSLDQASQTLRVSRRTLYYWIRDGRLLTVRTRGGSQRVLAESLDTLLSGRLLLPHGLTGSENAHRNRA